jgi:acyl-coenzyme A synthetase/AMP-(fatty) acid ligase
MRQLSRFPLEYIAPHLEEQSIKRAAALRRILGGEQVRFAVAENDPTRMLELVWVGTLARCIPVLNVKSSSECLRTVSLADLDRNFSQYGANNRDNFIDASWQPLTGSAIEFATSGTTGEQVRLTKSWEVLLGEAELLRTTFAIPNGSRFLSLVPPAHIYGFLFGALLPTLCQAEPAFVDLRQGIEQLTEEELQRADVVVTVPALWSPLREALRGRSRPLFIFSSAAAWGERRTQEFLELNLPTTRLFEILGSTETGGIGHHEIKPNPDPAFHLFDGVTLFEEQGNWFLRSPHLYPPEAAPWSLGDTFELRSNRTFLHKGRKDNIFKYCGKRLSITELEEALRRHAPACQVRCFFREDSTLPKGGILYAFVIGKPQLDARSLTRSSFASASDLPFPDRIFFLESVPVNSMGKTTLKDLLAMAGES